MITYGLSSDADVVATDVEVSGFVSQLHRRTQSGKKLGRVRLPLPGRHCGLQRTGRRGRGAGAGRPVYAPSPRPSNGSAAWTAGCSSGGRGLRRHGARRLRASPDGDRGDAGRRARRLRSAHRRAVPAPPLHPDPGPARGVRRRLRACRPRDRHRHLRGGRGADPGRERRARGRRAGAPRPPVRGVRADAAAGSPGWPAGARCARATSCSPSAPETSGRSATRWCAPSRERKQAHEERDRTAPSSPSRTSATGARGPTAACARPVTPATCCAGR